MKRPRIKGADNDKELERLANELSKEAAKLMKAKQQKRYKEAAEKLTEAINMRPSAKLYFQRGTCYRHLQDHDRYLKYFYKFFVSALLDYTVAIDNEPIPLYYLNRGICHRTMGKLSKSLADFEYAIEKDSQNGMLYLNRGLTLYDLGKKEASVRDYTKAIELLKEPKHLFKPYFHRGNTLRECNKLEESIEDLSKAAELDTTYIEQNIAYLYLRNAPVQNNLGLSLFEQKKFSGAVQRFTAAIEIDPKIAM